MDCKKVYTTETHVLLLCNRTKTSPTTTYSAIEKTTTSTLATTTEPTTAYPTTSFQERLKTTLPSTTTPLPSLRGSTTTARTEYIQPNNELGEQNTTNLALQDIRTKYIYVTSDKTENMATPQDLTALWIAFAILLVLVIGLAVNQYRRPRQPSIKPDPVETQKKNRNSWSNEPYMSRRNPLHKRKIPKEHRKSMEALRKQINQPPHRAPPVPPRPEVAQMKMREVVQSKRGVERLKYQMDKLKEVQKGINGTPNTSNE